jgi:hypothetical protein
LRRQRHQQPLLSLKSAEASTTTSFSPGQIGATFPEQSFIFPPLYYVAPPGASLPVEVSDNSQYANDDEINPDEIVKYLGENHYNDAENKRDYTPQ